MKFSRFLFIVVILFSAITIFAQSETEKGVELYRNGDFDGAITILQKVVETDKKDRLALTYLGASYVNKGKKEDAVMAFKSSMLIRLFLEEADKISESVKIISRRPFTSEGVSKEENFRGKILFAIELKSSGKIGFILPIENTLSKGLTKNATKAAQGIEFEPAKKDGKKVTTIKFFHYEMSFY